MKALNSKSPSLHLKGGMRCWILGKMCKAQHSLCVWVGVIVKKAVAMAGACIIYTVCILTVIRMYLRMAECMYTSKTTRCHKTVYVLIYYMRVYVSNGKVHLWALRTAHLLGLGPSASLTKADTLTCSPTLLLLNARHETGNSKLKMLIIHIP